MMKKEEHSSTPVPMKEFNPSDPGISNGAYFGLPFSPEESQLVLLPVPWEVTTSYGGGTSLAPDAILEASLQIDLFDLNNHEGWKKGIGTLPQEDEWYKTNKKLREQARKVILHLEEGGSIEEEYVQKKLKQINEGSEKLKQSVYRHAVKWMSAGKKVGIVGGDHSVPLGAICAAAERYPGMGILHVDAHADLREAYEGFTYSHASIMYNALKQAQGVESLVQVGVRDLCHEEYELAQNDERISLFDDQILSMARFQGENWDATCERIIANLPRHVYVSFDIDGLSPDHCPHTGTPVPGGLGFQESIYLLHKVVESGRDIIGFDLCEVVPDEHNSLDANIGARVLYKLCNFALI